MTADCPGNEPASIAHALLSLPLVNIFTLTGAALFFIGAALLIPAMRPEPAAAVAC